MRLLPALVLAVSLLAVTAWAIDPKAKAEIDGLILFVKNAQVRFIRNGQEYSGAEGADHLSDKLARAGDRVKTAEDFITGIASQSSLSGKPYQVKFADGRTRPVGDWLRERLDVMRKSKP